ncbi:MAG: LysM peptidoglycan-binding domain-containing protein [Fidelibacterota bacterium]
MKEIPKSNFALFLIMNKLLLRQTGIITGLLYGLLIGAPESPDSITTDSVHFDLLTEMVDSTGIPIEDLSSLPQIEPDKGFAFILTDAKEMFAEALIADHHEDTLEVVFLIDKIVALLNEAEQLGEMSADDQEEYDRFETTLLYSYENYFHTITQVETPIAIASLREELAEYLEPLEFEINGSKFQVIDDREGHIPLVLNKRVEQAIKFFQTKGRRNFGIWLSRYPEYSDLIIGILRANELPEELIFLAMIESGMNPKAYSRAHAAGMWQFISSTAKLYGLERTWWIDERRDPVKATEAAAAYLKDLYLEFDNWYLALAAYNAGSARVNRAIKLHQTTEFWRLHSLPSETRNFVPTFLAAAIITSDPERYGFRSSPRKGISLEEVVLEKSADLSVLAQCANISVETLKKINPELRQFATPPDRSYTLKLPMGKKETFTTAFNALPESSRFSPQYLQHRVRRGESLSTIASKYRVSMHDIAAVNKIRNYNRIREGTKLIIPVPSTTASGPVASASAQKPQKTVTYKVKKGDTLGHIAQQYGTTARTIRRWNGIRYGAYIYPSQKLTIPVEMSSEVASLDQDGYIKEIYVVRRGDTLSQIADRYRVPIYKIERWNNLSRSNFIHPGQKLAIYIKEG